MISIIIWLFSGAVGTLIGIVNNMYFNEEKNLGKKCGQIFISFIAGPISLFIFLALHIMNGNLYDIM